MLHAQGQYGEAEDVERQILQSAERVLGSDHPNTLSSMNNLAQMLQAEGDLAGTERLYRRWKAASACLGLTTPTRSPSLNNLAKLCRAKANTQTLSPFTSGHRNSPGRNGPQSGDG